MGRPRIHDARTAAGLLDAAEAMIEEEGLAALSMRALARRAEVTTRAIYSLFESKDELLGALAARGFELLGAAVAGLPVTEDPRADLIAAGMAYRDFALRRPALYQLAFALDRATESGPAEGGRPAVRSVGDENAGDENAGARSAQQAALADLTSRVLRVSGEEAATAGPASQVLTFHALCEGLAAMEHRRALRGSAAEASWRAALEICVRGIGAPEPTAP